MKRWACALVLAAATTVGVAPSTAAVAAKKPLLQRVVDELVAEGAPGAVAVVRTPARVRRAVRGAAVLRPRVRLRATDRFRVASVTKPVVATVVLQLVAEGKLSLDDSVERWLPGIVPNGAQITIRELLSHTSGLYNYTDDPAFGVALLSDPRRVWTPRELVAWATAHPSLFAPGTGWSYSNTNYVVLGLVVEAVTGTTLEQQLQARIFQPLALAATSFPLGTEIVGSHAHGYVGEATVPGLGNQLIDITDLLSPSHLGAAGALVSNGDDVTRFFSALLSGRLLPRNLLGAMKTRVRPGGSLYPYGLGLWIERSACGLAFGHVGDFSGGYRTIVWSNATGKRVAVVMVNIDTTKVSWTDLQTAAQTAYCYG
jgi:D-alanyl-D-alanine carboxypeptidase